MDKHLHIVAHEIPWPVAHGGLTDLFHKITSLHEAGVKIHLHVFSKTNRQESILLDYCVEVCYYPRSSFNWLKQPFKPYLVASRSSRKLHKRFLEDDYPILLEGTHCTHILCQLESNHRKIVIRLHNIEHLYYHQLAKWEKNPFKKLYYQIESVLLKLYEAALLKKYKILTVSETDTWYLRNQFKVDDVCFLPVFIPWQQLSSITGKGNYCMYHGNLSINENAQAAAWLLKNVFNELTIPFVIAGKNPPKWLKKLAYKKKHTCLVENPSDMELEDMIGKAHIHIFPSFNKTGVKLKVLHALYRGRFCLSNQEALSDRALHSTVNYYESAEECITMIKSLYDQSFNSEMLEHRKDVLEAVYNNKLQAQVMINCLY